ALESRGIRVFSGAVITARELVGKPVEKRMLGLDRHAIAVDMESFPLANGLSGSPSAVFALRAVSDGVDDELPPEIAKLVNQETGAVNMGRVTRLLVRRPSRVKTLWNLKARIAK